MFSNAIRIVLLLACLSVAVFCSLVGLVFQAGIAAAFIALIIFGYFKNGTVFLAFRKLGRNDFEGAEAVLKQTKYPQYLSPAQRAYYHFILGLIDAKKNYFQTASIHLKEALKQGLRTPHDRAIVLLNLCSIHYQLQDLPGARQYLAEAKQVNTNPALESQVAELGRMVGYNAN